MIAIIHYISPIFNLVGKHAFLDSDGVNVTFSVMV